MDGNITIKSEVSLDGNAIDEVLALESPVEMESAVPMLNSEIELQVISSCVG
jgi:hypothetical protein